MLILKSKKNKTWHLFLESFEIGALLWSMQKKSENERKQWKSTTKGERRHSLISLLYNTLRFFSKISIKKEQN